MRPSTASADANRQTTVYFTGTKKTPFSHIHSWTEINHTSISIGASLVDLAQI